MIEKLGPIILRFEEIETSMADPDVVVNYERVQELAKERASLEDLVAIAREYLQLSEDTADLEALIQEGAEPDLADMAREELESNQEKLEELTQSLRTALLPKNPNDQRDVIIEIRAGTDSRLDVDIMDANHSEVGGYNKIVFEVQGRGAFSRFKYESGVHRVQRVPETEAQGRIHTSTATVVVLPEADEVEVKISEGDLRIDIFHAGGHGGQNVNKVATAVRIVHGPSGLTVVCQDERSQYKNKQRAMAMLRARIFEAEQERHDAEISQARRSQVAGAERSEKIRTYNYPQDRVTDHRASTTFHGIPRLMDGYWDDIIDRMVSWEEERLLAEAGI
ncbi:Peptide chain release factor 1 [Geodia barretti]|uniref:Peptide chain release factor 1 n=1 Tax=Geodia barretti TaxID=519541 RepID=A0AA35XBF1_GEOBA|nr:Peptide chain release factor 1 [Geodia barretti]